MNEIVSWFTDPAHYSGEKGVPALFLAHVLFCVIALVLATVIAVPIGLFVGHTGRGGVVLVGAANVLRALPTLGVVTLLYLLLLDLSSGATLAAVIALVVLAIPPILAGTYAGVSEADAQVTDAAKGMGMTGTQKLWQVEVPIALPLLLGGVRNAMLQLVATAAVAAYVGLGGLGQLLIEGIALNDYPEVVAGAVFVAVLAVLADLVLGAVQRAVTPRGVRLAELAAKGKKVQPKNTPASAVSSTAPAAVSAGEAR